MTIDPYGLCPCGSGKKIKFCCGDLASEIDRVVRMIHGEQRVAALRLLNQLLKKHPDRVALLDMKAGVSQSLDQHDDAKEAVDRILEQQPDHPNALSRLAMVFSRQDDRVGEAVDALQRAVESRDSDTSMTLLEAFLHVGDALQRAGHIFGARAHFMVHLQSQPRDSKDSRSAMAMVEMNFHGGLPLLVRDELSPMPCPADVPWRAAFDSAARLAMSTCWRAAAVAYEALVEDVGSAPPLVYNLALLHGWLGDTHRLVEGLRQFARLDVAESNAAAALAVANLFDHGHEEDRIERIRRTYQVADEDRLLERLDACQHVTRVPVPNAIADPSEPEIPAPLARFLLLDRVLSHDASDLSLEDVPRILGVIDLHARATDHPARAEFTTKRNANLAQATKQFDAAFEPDPREEIDEQAAGSVDRVYDAISPHLRMPSGVPPQRQLELLSEHRHRAITDIWPTIPQHALGGRSPDEAARDPDARIDLLAALRAFETTSLASKSPLAVEELRDRLGVGPPESIDPSAPGVEVSELTIVDILRVETAKLSDEELVSQWRRAKFAAAEHALAHLSREAVRRPSLGERIDFVDAFRTLIGCADDRDEALDRIAEARTVTANEDNACGIWDLEEFSLYMDCSDEEGVRRIMNHLFSAHRGDRFVERQLFEVLSERGIDPNSLSEVPKEDLSRAGDSAAKASEIWTPNSEESVVPAGEKPAIWTP